MIEIITTCADALALLSLALGLAWLAGESFGFAWALIAFGAVILLMSAVIAEAARRKGGAR